MAMRKKNYDSIRGKFEWNVNQHPIQDFYLIQTVKGGPDGVQTKIVRKVFDNHKDSYYQDCKMPW
jgi:branched-chain amino acid transport system substrate-binding protein